MDAVDQIKFLSEKGHELLISGQYSAAKTFFIDAASLALEEGKNVPIGNKQEFESVAHSLLRMAQSAHSMTFRAIDSQANAVEKMARRIKSQDKAQVIASLSNEPSEDELHSLHAHKMSIPFGRAVNNGQLVVWKPETLMNGITLITGGSGSGKSESLRSLALELEYHKIPTVILDLHGDLDLNFETISLDYRGDHSINPMELTSYSEIDGGPAPHINRMMLQFDYAIRNKMSSTMKAWLRHLLTFAYDVHGITQTDPSGWRNPPPTFVFLLKLIRTPAVYFISSNNQQYIRLLETITTSTMMAVENRLAPILEHPAFSGQNNVIAIEKIANQPVRILLKPLNTVDMQFLAADTIIRQLYAYQLSKGHVTEEESETSKFRMFIMIDEVKILTGYAGKKDDPYAILNRLATEARKFGLGLILASQVINHFGRDIKSNAATKLILRTMDIDETKRCAKEFKLKIEQLSELSRPGEGYLSTSSHPEAQHIQMYAARQHPIKKEISVRKETKQSMDFI
ncbi:MAG: hypothetical protein ACXAE3_05125 [Candidatus Kariarchaeaceae archaeon]|jgi:hypothetical protein